MMYIAQVVELVDTLEGVVARAVPVQAWAPNIFCGQRSYSKDWRSSLESVTAFSLNAAGWIINLQTIVLLGWISHRKIWISIVFLQTKWRKVN